MESEGPPIRYPNLSSADVFGAGESTLAGSPPLSPRTQLPAYGDEGAPPQYQEDGEEEKKEASSEARTRRTLLIRLLTSIFITVLVSLIVAAVVGRIHDSQELASKLPKDAQEASPTGPLVTPLQTASTSAPIMVTLTANEALNQVSTSTSTSTISTTTPVTPTPSRTTFSCPYGPSPTITTITKNSAHPTKDPDLLASQFINQQSNSNQEVLLGVQIFAIQSCIVARATYRGLGNDLAYRCTLTC